MHKLRVLRNEPAATGLRLLTLDAPVIGYERPGQYVLAHVGRHEPAFFALASSPGEAVQLLVKDDPGTAAEEMVQMSAGSELVLSAAQGEGFPMERVEGLPLVCLVNGSGISAVRPVIAAEVARGLTRPVHLLWGVRSVGHRAFPWDLERWGNAGVQVYSVIDHDGADGWYGARGYVQEEAQRQGLIRADVGVVLCGLPQMLAQSQAMFRAAGCPEERLLVNF